LQNNGLTLNRDADGLFLCGNDQILRADFAKMLPRIRPANLNGELLIKAAKIKGIDRTPTAADATAGLGEDSFLLAAAGFSVRLYERDHVIAQLLHDALDRAASVPELTAVVGRMRLYEADSITELPALTPPPDVILLDPMFPERQKSGLIKKKLQFLKQLEAPCSDEDALLDAAMAAQPRKVVIKRPLKGAYLAGRKPDYSIKGNSIRYDCFVLTKKSAT